MGTWVMVWEGKNINKYLGASTPKFVNIYNEVDIDQYNLPPQKPNLFKCFFDILGIWPLGFGSIGW